MRLAGGFDPAAVQLADGTFLMVYCARSAGSTGGLGTPGDGPPASAAAGTGQESGQPQEAAAVVVEGQAKGSDQVGGASADSLGGSVADIGTNQGINPAGQSDEAGQEAAETVGSDEFTEQVVEALMPPTPDFVNHVDYLSWLQERYPDNIENNSQDAYLALMPHGVVGGGPAPDWWPQAFNDAFYENKPGPWLPEEHPDWEAAHQALQWPMEMFQAATLLPNYAGHYDFSESNSPTPPEERMVYEILLPGLANCRQMVKAALADGWRVENGQVDPEGMIESWTTCLGNADHLGQGSTVIEGLVGVAEQLQVQEHARLALQHGVFQATDELEKALNVLKDHDRQLMDQPRWVSCEAAAALQVTQYVFTPTAPDGQPQINVERLKQLLPSIGAKSEEELARFSQMEPADAFKTLDALGRYYRELTRKWMVGYPQVRHADMAELEMSTAHTTEITKAFLPSVGRVYHLAARNETSRRATQLTYEVHLFKARNGYWPASLDDLGLPVGDRTRTDPFTGGDFGYRLDEAGPTIYSLSENGRDDGGVHSPRWADDVKSDADSDDYVFWPPQ